MLAAALVSFPCWWSVSTLDHELPCSCVPIKNGEKENHLNNPAAKMQYSTQQINQQSAAVATLVSTLERGKDDSILALSNDDKLLKGKGKHVMDSPKSNAAKCSKKVGDKTSDHGILPLFEEVKNELLNIPCVLYYVSYPFV
jgi:hypothetical protein